MNPGLRALWPEGRPEVWVLNLDAEEELARGRRQTLPRPVRAAMDRARAELAGTLAAGACVELSSAAQGARGEAWSPTPDAEQRLRDIGARLTRPRPTVESLRRVSARSFAYETLGPRLEGSRVVRSMDTLRRAMAEATPGSPFILKRPFGAAGRGRLRLEVPDVARAERFATESSLRDGLVIEPWVEIILEVSLHAVALEGGRVFLGEPIVQRVERGVFRGAHLARPSELEGYERDQLETTTHMLGEALLAAGYQGPFGVDAYRFRDSRGRMRWNPCGELNARFTMGFALGMKLPPPAPPAESAKAFG